MDIAKSIRLTASEKLFLLSLVKLVPNPEYEKAKYSLAHIRKDGKPAQQLIPEIRTNNPNFLKPDGSWDQKDVIPSHIQIP